MIIWPLDHCIVTFFVSCDWFWLKICIISYTYSYSCSLLVAICMNYLFTSSHILYMSLKLKRVSCRQHIVGSIFKLIQPLSVIIYREFSPLMFNLIFFLNFLNSFFFFNFGFIYLFIFMAVLGLRFCARAFSSCGKWGPFFIAVRGPLIIVAFLVAEHRLQTRRLSNCGSRAQLLRGMWDLPRPGLEPVSSALAGRLSTTAPPGKP